MDRIEADRARQHVELRELSGRVRDLELRSQPLDQALAIAQTLAEATLRPVQVAAALQSQQTGPSLAADLPDEVTDTIGEFARPGTGLYSELVGHALQTWRNSEGDMAAVIAELRRGGSAFDGEAAWSPRPIMVADDDPETDLALAEALESGPLTPDNN